MSKEIQDLIPGGEGVKIDNALVGYHICPSISDLVQNPYAMRLLLAKSNYPLRFYLPLKNNSTQNI